MWMYTTLKLPWTHAATWWHKLDFIFFVTYQWTGQATVFVRGKPFQPSEIWLIWPIYKRKRKWSVAKYSLLNFLIKEFQMSYFKCYSNLQHKMLSLSNLWQYWQCSLSNISTRTWRSKTFYSRNLRLFVMIKSVHLYQAFPAQSYVCK